MSMRAGGGGGDELNSEINVTPMVDIMLVLLIIFMITAPMMNNGVDLDLPQVTAAKVDSPDGKLNLKINKFRKLKLNDTDVRWQDLSARLTAIQRTRHESELFIEADKSLPYEVVLTAMAMVKTAGIPKVMMLTEAGNDLAPADLDSNAALPAAPAAPTR